MEEPKGKVFVFVDFECLYNDIGFYCPKEQGWHETGRDDPRGKLDADWLPESPCPGVDGHQKCEDEDCSKAGLVKDVVFEGSPRHGHINFEAKYFQDRMLAKKYIVGIERRSEGHCNYTRWEIRETYSRPDEENVSRSMICRYGNSTDSICGDCRGFEETVTEVMPHTPELEAGMRKSGKELRAVPPEEMPAPE